MSYNTQELPTYIHTAGKITIITALLGVVAFALIFMLNIGAKEINQAIAQDVASTSVTVLNTPPSITVDAREAPGSSTSTPTNSGSAVTWTVTAVDSNAEDYYLLVCNGSTTPTANVGAAPSCGGTDVMWAVSAAASSGVQASAATTTTESFAEQNDWYAWVCDSVALNPRCSNSYSQGPANASSASPFYVNHRPTFTLYSDSGAGDPGQEVYFYATSSDTDTVTVADTVKLFVCSTNSFDTVNDTCSATTLASSTFVASNPVATYTVPVPTRDSTYGAWGFVIDVHGHEASGGAQATNAVLTVNNVAPTVSGSQIFINDGNPLVLSVEAGQTTGFTLQFSASDNNSCQNISAGDEVSNYRLSVFRSGVGTTTCDGSTGSYDPNNCYPSQGTTTNSWDLNCTASSTSCTYDGVTDFDTTLVFDCTFPLWYVADPTSGGATNTFFFDEMWTAGVAAVDDNNATSAMATSSWPQELNSFLMYDLDTASIPYGSLEPGDYTDPLSASTTLLATGNVGMDQRLTGESMCGSYTGATPCDPSSTSTIPEDQQVFATSTIGYVLASTSGNTLSSTTQKELEINIRKSTTTSAQEGGVTYWGIRVPGTITLAGSYTGENTFYGIVGEPARWY